MALLSTFLVTSLVNGYATTWFYYKIFGGAADKATTTTISSVTMAAALLYPGLIFGFGLFCNALFWYQRSTYYQPTWLFLLSTFVWFGLSLPLVYAGAYLGRQLEVDTMESPILLPLGSPRQQSPRKSNNNTTSQQSATASSSYHLFCTMISGGIPPFFSCFVEFHYVLTSIWQEYYYDTFGFLLLEFFIMLVVCAEVTVILTFFQLKQQDHNCCW